MKRIFVGVTCALLYLLKAQSAAALPQQPVVTRTTADSSDLRGTVISAVTGQALPNAVVSIPALALERFANDRGQFIFPRVPVGKYSVRARQLGFTPGVTDVTLAPGKTSDITIKLTRVAYRLTEMQVSSDWQCEQPGRPTSNAQAIEAFEQLEQNADRLRLMSQQYPFELRGVRRQYVRRSDGDIKNLLVDTIVVDGGNHGKYHAGQMVFSTLTRRAGPEYYLQLPTLLDFADDEFQRNHCFVVRGVDPADSLHQLRIDFKASRKLKNADVDGSVFLDTATYQLRSTQLRMTKIPSEIKGVQAVRVTATFREVRPGMPMLSGILGETDLAPVRSTPGRFQSIEEQQPIALTFLKQKPDSVGH